MIIINTKMLYLQEVPSVLTCRHREKGLLEGGLDGLDPRIATYITNTGLDGLLWVPNMDLDPALIMALVERWWLETHSFHLPHNEMTITLQDMEVIMGVLVDGLPMVGYTQMDDWGKLHADLLGHRLPNGEVGANKNIVVIEGPKVKAKWFEEQFSNPLPIDATKVLVQ